MNLTIENGVKKFRSEKYNYDFNMENGYFVRWGKTYEEDPLFTPFGPEILDIETSTICSFGCPFCYKSNTSNGSNMSLETFKQIIDTYPKYNGIHFLTQVAFGIGDIDADPTLWDKMRYCRDNGIIPNVTINGDKLTPEIVTNLKTLCGAISVSLYHNKDICYNAVYLLKMVKCKQVNVHIMISEETIERAIDFIYDYTYDTRISEINAVVFLSLKQKGRGESFNALSQEEFSTLVKLAVHHKVPFGFDSCGANKCIEVAKEIGKYDEWIQFIEPCESGAFSSFISETGFYYPCSFADKCVQGIDVKQVKDFKSEVWENKITCCERKKIMDNGRSCPYFDV